MELFKPIWMTTNEKKAPRAFAAIEKMDEQRCEQVARTAPLPTVRCKALYKVKQEDTLIDIAIHDPDEEVKCCAIRRINTESNLQKVFTELVNANDLDSEARQRVFVEFAKRYNTIGRVSGIKTCVQAILRVEDIEKVQKIMNSWNKIDVEVYFAEENEPYRFCMLEWSLYNDNRLRKKFKALLPEADQHTIASIAKGTKRSTVQELAVAHLNDYDTLCDIFQQYSSSHSSALSAAAERLLSLDKQSVSPVPTKAEKLIITSDQCRYRCQAVAFQQLEERNVNAAELWETWFNLNLKGQSTGFSILKILTGDFSGCKWEQYLPNHFFRILHSSTDFDHTYADGERRYQLDSAKRGLRTICERCYRLRPDLRNDILALDKWKFFAGTEEEYINFGGSGDDALWAHVGEDNPGCRIGIETKADNEIQVFFETE